jgi:hypothetical protein
LETTIKVNLSLCLSKDHATKMYGEWKHSFMHSLSSASHPGRFTAGENSLPYPLDKRLAILYIALKRYNRKFRKGRAAFTVLRGPGAITILGAPISNKKN